MKKIEGVIFDWAGTTVDFGCFAPVNAFVKSQITEHGEIIMVLGTRKAESQRRARTME